MTTATLHPRALLCPHCGDEMAEAEEALRGRAYLILQCPLCGEHGLAERKERFFRVVPA